MRWFFTILLFFVSVQAYAQSSLDPVNALRKSENISTPEKLNGTWAVISVASAGSNNTVALTPDGAFTVEKIAGDQYRVTIADGSKLSYLDDGIWRWHLIELTVVNIIDINKDTGIRGEATCNYKIRYSQVGVSELDLTAQNTKFTVGWTLSNGSGNPAIRIDGAGLSIGREAGQDQPFDLTLRMDHKTDPRKSLAAPAVTIPSCTTKSVTTIVTKEIDPAAADCLQTQMLMEISCPDCGPTSTRFNVSARNICQNTVKCFLDYKLGRGTNTLVENDQKWIRVSGKSSYSTSWTLTHSNRLQGFWISAPGLHSCEFA